MKIMTTGIVLMAPSSVELLCQMEVLNIKNANYHVIIKCWSYLQTNLKDW